MKITINPNKKFVVEVKGFFGRWTVLVNPMRNEIAQFATEGQALAAIAAYAKMTGKTYRIATI